MCKSKEYRYRIYIYGMGNEYNRLSMFLKLYKDKLEILGRKTNYFQDRWVFMYNSRRNE